MTVRHCRLRLSGPHGYEYRSIGRGKQFLLPSSDWRRVSALLVIVLLISFPQQEQDRKRKRSGDQQPCIQD